MSLASSTIDHDAWSDPRIHYLAQLAGYADGFDTAIGKLGRLWARCTFLQSDTPGETEIRAIFGARGVDLLVDSGLAERMDGTVRVRGAVSNAGKDRLGWYLRSSSAITSGGPAQQASAGKARVATARRDARGRLLPRNPLESAGHEPSSADSSGSSSAIQRAGRGHDLRQGSSRSSGPADSSALESSGPAESSERPASGSGSGSDQKNLSNARAGEEGSHTEPSGVISIALTERQRLNKFGWEVARLRHDLLRSVGIDLHAQAWSAMPTGPGGDELPKRIQELQQLGKTEAQIEQDIARVVMVADATARREGHLRYFKPTNLWARDSFWKSFETSPEQAAAPRGNGKKPEPERERGGINPLKFLKAAKP